MRYVLLFLSTLLVAASLSGVRFEQTARQNAATASSREEAYRANNIGTALLEQFKYPEGAAQFRRALRLDPTLALARINLGIALYNARDNEGAVREMKAALSLLPNSPQVHYMLGLIARAQNRVADAVNAFQQVLKIDPRDPGANINLGQMFTQQRKYAEAVSVLREAIASEPYSVTAAYSLAIALTRAGKTQEGQSAMKAFQELRQKPYGITLGQNYLEQGRYAEAISSTGTEPPLVDASIPEVTFADATSTMLLQKRDPGPIAPSLFGRTFRASEINDQVKRRIVDSLAGGGTLFDVDGDGDLDLLVVASGALTLFRNDGGRLNDITTQSGIAQSILTTVTAVSGDYDNDGRPDVLVVGSGRPWLYHNDGGGRFSDVTAAAAIPQYSMLAVSAAFLDADHDGDLDIFIAGFVDLDATSGLSADRQLAFPDDFAAAGNVLLQNQGNGKFADVSAASKVVTARAGAVAVAPTDFNNHRDIDLLLVNRAGAPTLLSNQRDGTFRDVASEVGLDTKGPFTCIAAADVNKDDFTDFFLGRADGSGVMALSDGRGRFNSRPAPSGADGAIAAQFLDYDNDGLLDLVVVGTRGVRVLRNLGADWADVTQRAVSPDLQGAIAGPNARPLGFSSADIDGDGDQDLVVYLSGGGLRIARNDGGNRNTALKVMLTSKVSNRSAIGTKIEVRSGSLRQKLETSSASPAPAPADIVFGLGKRSGADAVRVLWPAGIVQAETELAKATAVGQSARSLAITELDRKPSSCPYLYTWNGERFEFVTDFMGGGEMGYWESPGVHNRPDPDEYVRIRDDQLRPRNGRYELRITNELEEVVYLDRVRLIAIEHPADTEVYPNEGMTDPPRPFKLFTTRGARPPIAAHDDYGRDVLPQITRRDRRFTAEFVAHPIRGYAETHVLTLDLGQPSTARTILLLTGWTDYAFSSDNLAAHQSGLRMVPPRLEVKDSQGEWRTAIDDLGIPVGRPQTIVAELTGKFPTQSREVRIVTNMRIHWDEILVDDSKPESRIQSTTLEPVTADLHWRGFSAEVSPDGREPFGYDYDRVSPLSPWKVMTGRYTREGDVRELVGRSDDLFVVSRPGDEILLSFDAAKLRPLPSGRKRTFLLYADGFSKEMDINSAAPDHVEPLPFHGMKDYPSAARTLSRRHRDYVERYNTRVVASPLPKIEITLAGLEQQTKK